MTKKRFRATLETETDGGHFIRIPFDVPKTFGARGRVAVRGTLNGTEFRGSLFPYSGVHYLGLNQHIRAAAKLKAGDDVLVVLERAE
jgi:hypothetical protein